jgi:SAM-dependent methyltransferase
MNTNIKSKAIHYWNERHKHGQWKDFSGLSNFAEWLKPGQTVVELGCGLGPDILPPGFYVGLDLSIEGLRKRRNMRNAICCDISRLPLKDNSADLIFSNNVLEHIPCPDDVIKECCRIIKDRGIIIHRDVWFCRKWRTDGLFDKRKKMTFKILLRRMMTNIMEQRIIRWPLILIKRIWREFRYRLWGNYEMLEYKYFPPNLDEFLESDSDACVLIDPHALIMFYKKRGFEILRSRGIWGRLTHRKHVIVEKIS